MKIIRRNNGYSIRCSDGEFDAIGEMVKLSEGAGKLAGMTKSAYTRRTKGGDFLRIDDDRRA